MTPPEAGCAGCEGSEGCDGSVITVPECGAVAQPEARSRRARDNKLAAVKARLLAFPLPMHAIFTTGVRQHRQCQSGTAKSPDGWLSTFRTIYRRSRPAGQRNSPDNLQRPPYPLTMLKYFGCALFLLLGFQTQLPAAPLERWVYCAQNLWVDQNITELETLFQRAGKAGYTHVLLTDSKFSKLGDMDARYFRNVERVKKAATAAKLQLVPALFSIGYSNDLLWHDPNLIEALPVKDALFVVNSGEAKLAADPVAMLKGGDFADLKQWSWKDPNVTAEKGSARMDASKGGLLRITQKIKL